MNRQMNFADFTGIYLYPEAFGTQYVYDKNGNRKTRKMLYGGQEKSEFDDADNLTKHGNRPAARHDDERDRCEGADGDV